jgi:hypothetical protein
MNRFEAAIDPSTPRFAALIDHEEKRFAGFTSMANAASSASRCNEDPTYADLFIWRSLLTHRRLNIMEDE